VRCNIKSVDLKSFYLKDNQVCSFFSFTIHVNINLFIFMPIPLYFWRVLVCFRVMPFVIWIWKLLWQFWQKPFSKKFGWCPFLCKSEIATLHRPTFIKVLSHGSSQMLAFVFVNWPFFVIDVFLALKWWITCCIKKS